MAQVDIAFCSVGAVQNGDRVEVALAESFTQSQTITSSASNQQSAAAPYLNPTYVCIVTDGTIYLAFGSNPDATVTTARRRMLAGTAYFQIQGGNKVAVITG